jgi:hypothetical protein
MDSFTSSSTNSDPSLNSPPSFSYNHGNTNSRVSRKQQQQQQSIYGSFIHQFEHVDRIRSTNGTITQEGIDLLLSPSLERQLSLEDVEVMSFTESESGISDDLHDALIDPIEPYNHQTYRRRKVGGATVKGDPMFQSSSQDSQDEDLTINKGHHEANMIINTNSSSNSSGPSPFSSPKPNNREGGRVVDLTHSSSVSVTVESQHRQHHHHQHRSNSHNNSNTTTTPTTTATTTTMPMTMPMTPTITTNGNTNNSISNGYGLLFSQSRGGTLNSPTSAFGHFSG